MSTRAIIRLQSNEVPIAIYKHSDGYPSEVIPVLAPFIKRFFKNRGNDPQYLMAQIVRAFAVADYKYRLEDSDDPRSEDCNFLYGQDYTGWGLVDYDHSDYSYRYEIGASGQISINGTLYTDQNLEEL